MKQKMSSSFSIYHLAFRIGVLAVLGLSVAFAALALLDLHAVVERSTQVQNEGLTWQVLALGLGIPFITLFLVWFAIRRVVRPIRELTVAAHRIAHGELGNAISVAQHRTDEVGELARAFEEMRVSLAAQRAVMKLRTRELRVLHETALAGAEARDVDDLVARVTEILAEDLYPETVGFLFLNPDGECLHLHPSYHGMEPDMYDLAIPLGEGVTGTVAQTGKPLLVPDVEEHLGYIEGTPDVRSELCVPLRAGGKLVGVINVESVQPDAFSQEDLHVVSAVAGQVGSALERLRLFEEAQRRTTELEALRDVTLDITAQLKLSGLLKGIVRRATELLEAGSGSLRLYRPEREELELVVSHNLGEHSSTPLKVGEGLSGRVVATGQPLIVDDYRTWEGRASGYEEAPFGAVVGVPLRWQDRILGVINVIDMEGRRPFGDNDLHLLEAFARQAAIAIENARLFQAEQNARRRAETLQKAAAVLNSTLQLEELLDVVLEELQRVVPYESASVQLLRNGHLEIIAGRGFPEPREVIGLSFSVAGDNPNREVIARKEPVVIPDASSAYPVFQEAPHRHIRSWLGAPLLSKGEVIGMITLDRTEVNAFSEDEADIASVFANHVAIALENARLYEETRYQAVTDGLTGLYNSRYFYQMLEKELERSRRYGHRCSLIMLDLDDFKKYNDQYGHLAGDDLLRELADLICNEIRRVDTAARYGGEEFVVIVPETNGDQAAALAERLRKTVRDHEFVVREGQRVGRITVSQGVSTFPDNAQDVEGLVDTADMALLYAKEGKNRVCVAADGTSV